MNNSFIGVIFFVIAVAGIILYERYSIRKASVSVLKQSLDDMRKRKRNFASIKRLFQVNLSDNVNYIDDQTWNDLEMDKVFENLDITLTTPGEQRLYEILRCTESDTEILMKRNSIIESFQKNESMTNKIRKILAVLGRQNSGEIIDFLYGSKKADTRLKGICDALSIGAVMASISIIFIGYRGLIYLILISVINMIIHNKMNKKIQGSVKAITYLSEVAKAAYKLCDIDDGTFKDYRCAIMHSRKVAETILKNSSVVGRL